VDGLRFQVTEPACDPGDVYMEFDAEVFHDFYERRAHAIVLSRGILHPQVQGAVVLVETRLVGQGPHVCCIRTGREVYGRISAIHAHYYPNLITVHFRQSGRTWPLRNELAAHPEQNALARHYFGVPDACLQTPGTPPQECQEQQVASAH
jgi:hypothetical protein